jgi:TPR repeat protein
LSKVYAPETIRLYYKTGVKQDYAAAASWYRKAADQGDLDAKKALAKMGISYP